MSERVVLTLDDAHGIGRLLDFALPHVDLASSELVAASLVAEKLLNASSDVVLVFGSSSSSDGTLS